MKLDKLVSYLNNYLCINDYRDISQNGLQVEGTSEIKKVAIATDACMDTFKETAKMKAQILIVHHGLFWGKSLLVTGVHQKRLAYLLEKGISLYAVHLPLDGHQELGNNAQLAKLLGLEIVNPFGSYRGMPLGVEAKSGKPIDREPFAQKALEVVGNPEGTKLLGFGPQKIQSVAIVSGSGGSCLDEVANKKIDFFITGEGSHPNFHMIKEHKLNVLYAGHYATETLGVKAVAEHLKEKFALSYKFIHIPTGF